MTLPSKPGGKPPFDVNVTVDGWAKRQPQSGVAARSTASVARFMVVAAMLDSARHAEDGEPLFLVKAGSQWSCAYTPELGRQRISTPPFGRALTLSPIISIPSYERALCRATGD